MTDPDMSEDDTDPHINFDAPASLRKWPSLNNERRPAPNPYLIFDGTLDQCIREFMARPAAGKAPVRDPHFATTPVGECRSVWRNPR